MFTEIGTKIENSCNSVWGDILVEFLKNFLVKSKCYEDFAVFFCIQSISGFYLIQNYSVDLFR